MKSVKEQFPILQNLVHAKPLVYLDSAATSQKPQKVIDAVVQFYEKQCANVHRGVHWLSEVATREYELSRKKVQHFINARCKEEIIFTKGTTEGINLVASTFGQRQVGPGDEIIVSEMEHHSNIVPWQMLCEAKGAVLRVAPIDDNGDLKLPEFYRLLNAKTKIVAITHISNALGTINPLKEIIAASHECGAAVIVDGAQAVPHEKVDVQDLNCDFYVFSAHKMYGPTGVGVLYGKHDLLDEMPPYQGGGDMIASVTFAKTTYAKIPYKFEAGTPNIAGVIGLGAAIDFINEVGIQAIAKWEHSLLQYAEKVLSSVPGLRKIGTSRNKAAVFSFVLDKVHPHDVSSILDRQGLAIRAG
ncbi:MAG: cysteine desulfurase, partial [bacterium]|nr:cysteine desulfurase [bacterium]